MLNLPDDITRKLSAIMFVDIAGYSKMMGKDVEKTLDLIDEYKNILKHTVKEYKGSIVKWLGDGTLCEFYSAVYAVDCAKRIHEQFVWTNKGLPKKQKMYVRIGIHVGEVSLKDNDLYGNAVNVASRIESIAPVGGIAISGSVYPIIKAFPRYKINRIKNVKLKNIEYNYDVYTVKTGCEKRRRKKYREIFSFTAALLILGIFYFSSSIFEIIPYESTDNSKMDLLNSGVNYPLEMQKEKYLNFVNTINSKKSVQDILEYLKLSEAQKTLKYFKNPDSFSESNTCVLVINGDEIKKVLLKFKNEFYDLETNKRLNDTTNLLKDNTLIWVKID